MKNTIIIHDDPKGKGTEKAAKFVAQLIREGVIFKARLDRDATYGYKWIIELTGGF